MLLLDEPTSNLDALNEAQILQVLKQQKNCKIIFMVTHRRSSLALSDRLFVMEHGQLREE